MRKISTYFYLVFLLLFAQDSYGQKAVMPDNFIFIVDTIFLKGNDITDEDIILRELTFGIGDSITTRKLDYNEERIFSLGIFSKVEIIPSDSAGINKLTVLVEESWYIYPLPLAFLEDGDWDKLSYGFDVILQNFRGRNELLRTRLLLGYDKSFLIGYTNPYLVWEDNIFFSLDLSYSESTNRSLNAIQLAGGDFDQKFIRSQIILGKRFGLFHRASVNLAYNYIETPFFIEGINASRGRIDRVFSLGAAYSYDTRDLSQFPKDGILGVFSVQFKGLGINDINYQILNLDLRQYQNLIGDLYGKWRFASRNSFGPIVPFYDFSYLGSGEKIRGHFTDKREGHHLYKLSTELYHPIVRDVNITLDFIPLIPKRLLSYRVALYAQLFGETGTTRFRGEPLSVNNFQSGYGIGLTLLVLPYNVLRAEYAFDENLNGEIILDLSVSF